MTFLAEIEARVMLPLPKNKIPAQLAPYTQNPRTATDPNSIRGHCLLADDITIT